MFFSGEPRKGFFSPEIPKLEVFFLCCGTIFASPGEAVIRLWLEFFAGVLYIGALNCEGVETRAENLALVRFPLLESDLLP